MSATIRAPEVIRATEPGDNGPPAPSQGELTVGPRPLPTSLPQGCSSPSIPGPQASKGNSHPESLEEAPYFLTVLTDHWVGVHVPFPALGVPGIPSYLFSNKARLERENWGVTLSPRPGLGWVPTSQFPPAVSHLSRLDRKAKPHKGSIPLGGEWAWVRVNEGECVAKSVYFLKCNYQGREEIREMDLGARGGGSFLAL